MKNNSVEKSVEKFANNLEKMSKEHCNDINELRVESMVNKMCMTPFNNYNQAQNETIIRQIKLSWRKKDGNV